MFAHKYTRSGEVIRFQVVRKNGDIHTVRIDAEDFDKVSKYTWCVVEGAPNLFYAQTTWYAGPVRHRIYLSHLILGERPEGHEAHHLSGDPLDCRKANLRWMTRMELTQDKRCRPNKSTGERSIVYMKNTGRYIVTIYVLGKRYIRTTRDFQTALRIRDELFAQHGYRVEGGLRVKIA